MRALAPTLVLLAMSPFVKADPAGATKPAHRIEATGTDNGGSFSLYQLSGGTKVVTFEIGLSNRLQLGSCRIESNGQSAITWEDRPFVWDEKKETFLPGAYGKGRRCQLRFDKEAKLVDGFTEDANDQIVKEATGIHSLIIEKVLPALEAKKITSITLVD